MGHLSYLEVGRDLDLGLEVVNLQNLAERSRLGGVSPAALCESGELRPESAQRKVRIAPWTLNSESEAADHLDIGAAGDAAVLE